MTKNRIQKLSDLVANYLFEQILGDLSESALIEKFVPTHYGASHLGAALILLGELRGKESYLERGQCIIRKVLTSWDEHSKKGDFHYDFNNFALAVVLKCSTSVDSSLLSAIIHHLISKTEDSNHNTVNWLPMRRFVNTVRLEYKDSKLFRRRINKIDAIIRNATNDDGGIEDQLPYGVSYNLQYNISSVAGLLFNNLMGEEEDLSRQIGFLLEKELPDGDINYLGRGSNQIFAWGHWLYILSSCNLRNRFDYLEGRIKQMLTNNNLMLNEYKGEDKFQWYDYHHSLVYISHFSFWLVMSELHSGKANVNPTSTKNISTGLVVEKNEYFSVVTFSGRMAYSAEHGPTICAITSSKYGALSKGISGPEGGDFGVLHSFPVISNLNHTGLIEVRSLHTTKWARLILNFFPRTGLRLKNLYSKPSIYLEGEELRIKYKNVNNTPVLFSFVSLIPIDEYECISFFVEQNSCQLLEVAKIKTQYGWAHVIQSNIFSGNICELRIK